MTQTVLHTWNASVTFEGKEYNFGNTSRMLLSDDLTKAYQYPEEIVRVATPGINKEFGEGTWTFTDKNNSYKFNAYPASDYGWSR